MTTIQLHPAWCDDHRRAEIGSADWHQSREHAAAGGYGVVLEQDDDPRDPNAGKVMVRAIGPRGEDLLMPLDEAAALVDALRWALAAARE